MGRRLEWAGDAAFEAVSVVFTFVVVTVPAAWRRFQDWRATTRVTPAWLEERRRRHGKDVL